jgi:carbon-monoxide dehydrogenase medium subunit
MGVAALVTLDENSICQHARLVYLNAGDGPVAAPRAAETLQGQTASAEAIDTAANIAADDEINPMGNVHGTPDYQRHLARVLTRRALKRAFERAWTP